jgi:hypothetical protein
MTGSTRDHPTRPFTLVKGDGRERTADLPIFKTMVTRSYSIGTVLDLRRRADAVMGGRSRTTANETEIETTRGVQGFRLDDRLPRAIQHLRAFIVLLQDRPDPSCRVGTTLPAELRDHFARNGKVRARLAHTVDFTVETDRHPVSDEIGNRRQQLS